MEFKNKIHYNKNNIREKLNIKIKQGAIIPKDKNIKIEIKKVKLYIHIQ